jgi:hypothetical protein
VKAQGAPVGNMNAAKQTDHVSGKDDPFVSTAETIAAIRNRHTVTP